MGPWGRYPQILRLNAEPLQYARSRPQDDDDFGDEFEQSFEAA
jgi:hypothetical protein